MMVLSPRDSRPDDPESPEALLSATVEGDLRAREVLARWCLPRVRRTVLLSCGRNQEADDIVQNAMAKVFSRLESFRGEASFYLWVDRITINAIRDHFRRRRFVFLTADGNLAEPDPHLDFDAGHRQAPDRQVERSLLFQQLSTHFAAIGERRRLPLLLSLLHGYKVPEIAAMLDLNYEAAKKRLIRGRKELMKRLKKDPRCWEMLRELKP